MTRPRLRLRTALGDDAYMAATDRGRGLTVDQVLEITSAG